jgi:hypothetical protein
MQRSRVVPWRRASKSLTVLLIVCTLSVVASLRAQNATSPPPDISVSNTVLERVRVATWDVNRGRDASGLPASQLQLDQLASTGAQVISLQHVLRGAQDLITAYKAGLEARTDRPWTAVFVSRTSGPTSAVDEGVLLLTSLLIDGSEGTQLVDNAPAPERQGVAVRVQVTVNSQPVNFFGAQLDTTDAANRAVQLDRLQSWINSFSSRRVVVGAFGAEPGDAVWSSWRGSYRDVWQDLVFSKTGDEGITVDVAPSTGGAGRVDYQWQASAVATDVSVWKSRLSTHHLLMVDYEVQ